MNDNNDPVIPLISLGCVRYTVPSAIHLSKMPDKLKVRFRVGKVVKNCASMYTVMKRIARNGLRQRNVQS